MGITSTSSLSVIRPKANLASYYPCELTTGAFTMSIGGTNFAPDMILQASGMTVTTQDVSPWSAKIIGTVPAGLKIFTHLSVTLPGPGRMTHNSSTAIKVNGGAGSDGGSPQTVSVSVTASTANVLKGATQQFSASVSNNANTSVTWSVTGGGNVSTTGLYTAPSVVPNPATVTVKATSNADNGSDTKERQGLMKVSFDEPKSFGGRTQHKVRIAVVAQARLIEVAVSRAVRRSSSRLGDFRCGTCHQ